MIQGEEIFCFFVTILSWDYTKSLRWVGLRVSLLGLLWSMLLLLWSMLLTVAFYFVFWYETNELDAKVVLFFLVGAWDFKLVMQFGSSVILPILFLFLATWVGFSLSDCCEKHEWSCKFVFTLVVFAFGLIWDVCNEKSKRNISPICLLGIMTWLRNCFWQVE